MAIPAGGKSMWTVARVSSALGIRLSKLLEEL